MPQYTDSTGITWNYTLSGSNATIGVPVNFQTWEHVAGATTLRTNLSGAITIPSTVDGYTVTGIGGVAFYNCTNLTSIDLSGTQVTTIGSNAFSRCSKLTSITIPDSVTTIDAGAFNESGLTSIDLSGTQVETISQNTFYQCSNLTSIHLPNSVTTIGSQAFYLCSKLTSVTLPTNSLFTTIGYAAFALCSSLSSITIPDSVTTIGESAFNECFSLTSITIPDSVTTIDSYAFYNISFLPIVYVKDVDPNDAYTMTTLQNTISGKIYGIVTYEQWVDPNANANAAPGTPTLSDISCNENTNTPYTATVSATDDNGDVLTFSLGGPDSADFTLTGTSLSANAVFDFETKATYNITITTSDGTDSTSADFIITVNNVVETASDLYNANVQGAILKTTADNDGITTQQLVAAGYTIEQLVAAGFQIWNYTLDANNNASIGDDTGESGNATFLGTSLSGAITIPSTVDGHTVTGIGQYAFYQCTSLTSIDLPNSVTSIGDYAFLTCSNLTSIDIGDSVTTIGSQAFSRCTSLTSITIPESVTTIGSEAFMGAGFTSITVDDNNISFSDIDGVLFNKDHSTLIQYPKNNTATSYTIPDSVTTIGRGAVWSCRNLTSIHIPDSVTTIGWGAFQFCHDLTSVTLPTNPLFTTIANQSFYNCTSLTSIIIPDSVTTIDEHAFRYCSKITSITIPDSVTSIGNSAFNGIGSPSTVTVKDVDPNKTLVEGLEYIGGPGRDHGSDGGLMDGKISGTVTYQHYLTSTPFAPYLSNVSFAYDGTTKYSATVVSNDLEGDNFTFSLSGADAASFNLINYDACNNALLESVNPWVLNAPFTYSVTIKATDSTDLSAISLVSIAKIFTATELFTNNISGSTLKTLADQSSISFQDLSDAGYTREQLLAAGFLWNYTLSGSNASIGDGTGNYGSATTLGTDLSGAITIPSTITDGGVTYNVTGIDAAAFRSSGLTSITIPDSVTTIGDFAFAYNDALESITVEQGNVNYKTIDNVLFNFSGTELIKYPVADSRVEYTIPDTVVSVLARSFGISGTIGSLTKVNFPSNLQTIGSFAFRYNQIDIFDLSRTQLTTIEPYGLYYCPITTSIILPDSVTTISTVAMAWCSGLTSIHLGNSLTSIGNSVFYQCSSLTSITIPDSVTTIGRWVFDQCTNLTSITLPTNNNFTTISSSCFYGASGLTSITIPDSVTTIGSSAFYICTGLTSIHLPNSVTTIGHQAFRDCSSLTSITLPTNPLFTTISDSCFYSCSSLTSVDLGNSVETIVSGAFEFCSSLTSITIPDSVTSIGFHAFYSIGSPSTVYVKNVDSNKTPLEGLEYIGGPGLNHDSDGGLMDGKITGAVTYKQWVAPIAAPRIPTLSDISCRGKNCYTLPSNATSHISDNRDQSGRIARLKAIAIGKSSRKSGLARNAPLSFRSQDTTIRNSALRRVRGGGAVAPAKKGALENTFKSGGGSRVTGSGNRLIFA